MSRELFVQVGRDGNASHGTNYIHVDDASEDSILHGEPDHTVRSHILPQRLRLLPTGGRGRKDDHVYQYLARLGCVSTAGFENPTTDVDHNPSHRKVSALHLHHEYIHYPHHCYYNQLELSHPEDSPHA